MSLYCDYLVIGSGAASLAFVDTLLEEMPHKQILLVDKKPSPGGHWVDAYDFVKLHQPSIVYGLASKSLEGSWTKLLFTKFTLPWKHRASKSEINTYFKNFVDSKTTSGQLQYFPECVFDFDQKFEASESTTATFVTLDGKLSYTVEVREKLIDGVRGECIIPSLSPPEFLVADGIHIITPNELHGMSRRDPKGSGQKEKHFVVLGAGKTAMDTVVFLQTALKVNPSRNVSWVIPNDVWMLSREGGGGPSSYQRALLRADGDKDKACTAMEAAGKFVRLELGVVPTCFRFPLIGKDEVKLLRRVDDKIRRGRVLSIGFDGGPGGDIVVRFEQGQEDWVLSQNGDREYVFVHCTSPGPFNGKTSDVLFDSERKMTLGLLYVPPISISMSCIAKLESALQQETLDVAFGRILLKNDDASPNEVLRRLIKGVPLQTSIENHDFLADMKSIITQASFIALLDHNPMVGYNWLKSNRLSMFSVPGFKGRVVEDMHEIVLKGKMLGSPSDQLEMIKKVADKLEPLRGK